jgi:hypothetical protein
MLHSVLSRGVFRIAREREGERVSLTYPTIFNRLKFIVSDEH